MSKVGVLIFGFSNEKFDYLRLAIKCAERVTKVWRLPVTVVSDVPFSHEFVNSFVVPALSLSKRNYTNFNAALSFINANRQFAYDYSPYDYTLVLDADFIVNTTQVLDCLSFRDLRVSKDHYSVTGSPLPLELKHFSSCGLPLSLATIVAFPKTSEAALFFKLWKTVTLEYEAYSYLYKFSKSVYRNDYCVTIALDLLQARLGYPKDSYQLQYVIPTVAFNVMPLQLDPEIILQDKGCCAQAYLASDLHFLNKSNILNLL